VVVVRDGGKVLVPVSSLKSTEKEATDSNEFAVATHIRSKDKKAKMSQMANHGKQPALAAVGQKGTPTAAAPEVAMNNTPNALLVTKEAVLGEFPVAKRRLLPNL
jgi:hypothetical protein